MSNNDTNTTETPEQESNGRGKSFLTVLLMVVLIGTGIYAFLRGAPEEDELNIQEQIEEIRDEDENEGEDGSESEEGSETEASSEESEEISSSEEATDETTAETTTTEEEATSSQTDPEVVATTNETITVEASQGDGVTHLARKALQKRLESEGVQLSAAQKIYAETVLTQNESYYQDSLNVSEEIDFATQDIDNVIAGAQNLSQSQIDAWNVYVPHVPSL